MRRLYQIRTFLYGRRSALSGSLCFDKISFEFEFDLLHI